MKCFPKCVFGKKNNNVGTENYTLVELELIEIFTLGLHIDTRKLSKTWTKSVTLEVNCFIEVCSSLPVDFGLSTERALFRPQHFLSCENRFRCVRRSLKSWHKISSRYRDMKRWCERRPHIKGMWSDAIFWLNLLYGIFTRVPKRAIWPSKRFIAHHQRN